MYNVILVLDNEGSLHKPQYSSFVLIQGVLLVQPSFGLNTSTNTMDLASEVISHQIKIPPANKVLINLKYLVPHLILNDLTSLYNAEARECS